MRYNEVTVDGIRYNLDDIALGKLLDLEQRSVDSLAQPTIQHAICERTLNARFIANQNYKKQKRKNNKKKRFRY